MKIEFSLEKLWDNYADSVLPENCGLTQYRETKNAFYGGFIQCFAFLTNVIPELSDEGGEKMMCAISDNIDEFIKERKNIDEFIKELRKNDGE